MHSVVIGMKPHQILSLSALATISLLPSIVFSAEAPAFEVLGTKVISQQPEYYHGWPTVARRANGELWVSWSGGRESHVCPFGQVHAMTSRDDGKSWTWPRVLLDGAIDDRDSGVLETAKGTLLVTTFTSLAYEDHFKKASTFAEHTDKGWISKTMPAAQFAKWHATHSRLNDTERKAELGQWLIRSTDGGLTWGARIPTIVNSPHGPTQLKDGRLLYVGKQLWTGDRKIGVCESKDDGLSWQWLADIPTRKGDDAAHSYHELHAVEAADGTIIAEIRNHNEADKGGTLQTESKDGGKTWSEPHPITFGLPSHLLRLRNGRLLMTYGHRRPPFGNQARLSTDHGQTWSEPMILSGNGKSGDLGYPSTVELENGSFLTVWYESMAEPKLAVLRQAKWKLK
jgi:sialidase-1